MRERALRSSRSRRKYCLASLIRQRQADRDPSRSQKLRLRRIGREEEALAGRSEEIATAIEAEGALVSGQLMANVASDLRRVARDISEEGDYRTGERTQALQRDVEEALIWMLEALRQEQARRQNESQDQQRQQQGEPQPGQGENKPGLIPDTAEIKLLRRMEIDLQESVDQLIRLNPELAEADEVDERVLREITRLATRHEKITELFSAMRERLGIEAPEPVED